MKNKKKLRYVVSCVCVLVLLLGLFAVVSSAAESVTKYNYMDVTGSYTTTALNKTHTNLPSVSMDEALLSKLDTEGAGVEYTFGMTINKTIDGTIDYGDTAIRAFIPSDKVTTPRGYGVLFRFWNNRFYFMPNWVPSADGLGGSSDCWTAYNGYTGPNNTGYKTSASVSITDADLTAKLNGNGETIQIVMGCKVYDIEADGTVVIEYSVSIDGKYATSIYVPVNKVVASYEAGKDTAKFAACYNTVAGGSMRFTTWSVKIGGAELSQNDNRYSVILSDIRPVTLVPEVDTSKGTMLINNQTGNVTVSGPATATVTPKTGYDVAGLMVGSQFIPAPADVGGTYTFNVTPKETGDITVKAMFVKKADMLDYGANASVTAEKGKGAKAVMIADESSAAHNTEFDMKVTFTDDPSTDFDLKMVQIGAFLQAAKADGSNYSGDAKTWASNPYTPEYGFLVKLSHNVIYLCTNYGRIDGDVIKGAQLDATYFSGSNSGYGWAKKLFDTPLAYGDTIELGLGEIQVDENNIIYYIRMNGEVILSVPVDLSKKLTVTSTGGYKVENSQNHVGNRVAFTSGDAEIVTISSNKTKVDNTTIDFMDVIGTLPVGSWATVPEQYYLSQNGNRVSTVTGGSNYVLEAAITETAPKLGQDISLYYTAVVKTSYGTPVLSYVYGGQSNEITGKSLSVQGDYTTYEFAVDIFPQDMSENISATLKAGGTELCKMSSFSMQSYCRKLLDKIEAGQVADNGLKQLLISVLYYGDAAQKYFDGVKTPNCTAVLTDAEKALYSASVDGANSVLEGVNLQGFTWKEATLLLQDHPIVRFYFDTEWTDVTIKVNFDGKEYSYGKEDIKNWGFTWYFDFDELKPTDFDKEIKVTVYKGDKELDALVNYSANTYIYNQKNTEGLGEILAALYTYGVAAENYYAN